jgi:hypothetical protein
MCKALRGLVLNSRDRGDRRARSTHKASGLKCLRAALVKAAREAGLDVNAVARELDPLPAASEVPNFFRGDGEGLERMCFRRLGDHPRSRDFP